MSTFSTKIFGLIGGAMLFSSLSFGATSLGCTAATTAPALPLLLRAEDTAAMVSDMVLTCAGSAGAANTVIFTYNGTLNSPAQTLKDATGSVVGNTEITLQTGGVNYVGTATAGSITFSNVTIPAGGVLQISNVRVNSSLLAIGVNVTGSMIITQSGTVTGTASGINVGYVVQGFNAAVIQSVSTAPTLKTVNYTICGGNPASSSPVATITKPSFGIVLTEAFAGAYKIGTSGPPQANTEAGSFNVTTNPGFTLTGPNGAITSTIPAAYGNATHGTRFAVALTNVPQNATLWFPITVTGTNSVVMKLGTQGATGAFKVAADNSPSSNSNLPAVPTPAYPGAGSLAGDGSIISTGWYGVTSTTGTATVYYDVTGADNTKPNESATIPVLETFAANAFQTAQAAVGVTVTPAPTGSTDIPNFAAQTPAALSGSAIGLCQTNLLFSYVLAVPSAGWDTGIAISNTGTDPGLGATSTSGTCALNFYGTGAPTPNTGVATPASFTSPVASGTTSAFQLSQVASGFSGYIIAQCNFQFAHGFAYIIQGAPGSPNFSSMGYIANVIVASPRAATESLGQ